MYISETPILRIFYLLPCVFPACCVHDFNGMMRKKRRVYAVDSLFLMNH